MKKFFFVALSAFCLMNVAQAQNSTAQTRASVNGAITNDSKVFKQQADDMKAALNANDVTKAQTLFNTVYRMMAKRGDELRKVNNDAAGAEKRYAFAGRLKNLSVDMTGHKTELVQLLDEMKAGY